MASAAYAHGAGDPIRSSVKDYPGNCDQVVFVSLVSLGTIEAIHQAKAGQRERIDRHHYHFHLSGGWWDFTCTEGTGSAQAQWKYYRVRGRG